MQVERGILNETSVDFEIPSGGRVSNAWATCPVQGDNSWKRLLIPVSYTHLHDASNCEYTYLDIRPKRGSAGMEQCGVLPEFKGIAMHDCWSSYWNYPDIQHADCWSSYWNYPDIQHAVCCAHLLRELTGIDENHPEQKWASAFTDLLLEMKKVKDKAVEKGKDSLSYYHYHKFDKKYDELIEQARKENPLPETTEKKRGRRCV